MKESFRSRLKKAMLDKSWTSSNILKVKEIQIQIAINKERRSFY